MLIEEAVDDLVRAPARLALVAETTRRSRLPAPPAPLRVAIERPRFARLAAAIAVSALGDPLTLVASLVILYALPAASLAVTAAYAVKGLAAIAVAFLGLGLTDRSDRRALVVRLEAVRTLLLLATPLAVSLSPWCVLLVIFVSAAVEALVQPSRQAAIPLLVPAADVEAANGLVLALTTAAGAVGFGLAGILVLALPSPLWLFACDAATFALAGALVFSVGNIGGETPGVSLRSGFRRAFSGDARPYLFIAIVGALVIPLGVPILLPYAYELSRDGAQTFSVLEIALLAGAVAGSLAVSRIARVGSARAMAGGMALTGVAAIAMAASTALLPALIAAFFSTVGNATYVIANQSATVRAAPPSERGRVMATRFSVTQACSIAALAAGGALAVAVGAHATYLIVGGALLLAALAPLVLRRRSARFAS